MSHHLSAPNLTSPLGDARLDMTDLFVFPAATPGHTVLILDVHPIAPASGAAFHPAAVYKVQIDTDGDDVADVAYSFVFSDAGDDRQTATVYRAEGEAARGLGAEGEVITGAPVASGDRPQVVSAGDYRFSAGLRSDPFFADLDGIVKGFHWTGVDWGADKNVLGIVLEVPDSDLGSQPVVGVWGRVSVLKDGALVSVDRGAHPSLTAYFNAEDVKDAYNAGEPATDWATYRQAWIAALQHTGDYSPEAAEKVLRVVLPDVLHYDRTRPAMYPNGRVLTDDVTSARLAMLTNGKVPTDNIGPHGDLLVEFPYLGHPHTAMASA
jgi:hypothetical protein